MDFKLASQNIRDSGMTIRGWATRHGFKPNTLYQLIAGTVGKREVGITKLIIDALKADGFAI